MDEERFIIYCIIWRGAVKSKRKCIYSKVYNANAPYTRPCIIFQSCLYYVVRSDGRGALMACLNVLFDVRE